MIFDENEYVVLPANVQAVYCVTEIGVANTPRRMVYPPEGVSNNQDYAEPIVLKSNYALINKEKLVGDLTLKPGFNCAINTSGNEITVHARQGAGGSLLENQAEEIPVTAEEEELLSQGKYLSRGMKCSQVVATINGVEGPVITLEGGGGIEFDTESEPHTIIIKKSGAETNSSLDSCPVPDCN